MVESVRADVVRRVATLLDVVAPADPGAAATAFDALLEEVTPEELAAAVAVAAPAELAELAALGRELGRLGPDQ